ncbi:uncharacterized protein J7T54_003021 [Emericellopsis cladophorae]|uniref:Peptidase S33 tripeptidyl aminopeptidase-like C-terminal domain-containing protein n=1 Tax=Emericellopsis cladophorae TaxID=2686198 RepID=A0A9Q0BBY1_9HYPO|nr:uncharacterized protein J7T54_003021 [Emericellopsis cladophorae]KAI6780242.1 hypothetical protein J7T54_003021 [Emericellopsis cladophorae]
MIEKSARTTPRDNHPSQQRPPWAYYSTLIVITLLPALIYYPPLWKSLISTFSAVNAKRMTSYPHETIQWTSCGKTTDHPLECAYHTVPSDHFNASNPGTGQFPIIRLRGKSAVAGRNLLVNPGGPGNSGIDYVTKAGKHINTLVGEDHHIVSWAPRPRARFQWHRATPTTHRGSNMVASETGTLSLIHRTPMRGPRPLRRRVANAFQYYISEPDMEMMTDTDRTFVGFLEECVAAGDDCPLTQVSTSKDALLESTHYGTIDFRGLFIDVIFPHLQALSGWHLLASKLAPLLQGNATEFFLQYAQMSQYSINTDAFHMIMSNDGLTGPAHWPQDLESLLEGILPKLRGSRFARLANERFYIKQQWKIPRTHPFSPYQGVKLETPPLILTQRYDAVTPVVSAISARDAFPGSRMVIINGYGHCSTALPSLCSARILRTYLNEGRLPETHEECEVDGPIFVRKGDEDDKIPKYVWEDEEKRKTYMAMRDFMKDLLEG